ncbi:hypothetical protein [Psychrobacillus sp. BL-248-WT-3]|uniref:hypothetical protein n=1 Tax=Psychrobacillus sp. BL-248-WT-3 TaxID=2725306 RepID=UPI00146D0174|nr:hypothetical protein [Psychrobacillus sp. BL-248-WT-3]NME04991.1 hypothetical protein [Psychrobacillus sp. BL-248-WT-3]
MGRLREEDFAVLRGPLESGRQSPGSLGFALILGIFIQALMFALLYFMVKDVTTFPNKEEIMNFYFWLTAVLIGLCVLYSLPYVYNRSGRIQYLISIIVTQNMSSIPFLLVSLFLIGMENGGINTNKDSLLQITYIILAIGILIFIVTFIRFYILLKKGHYRKGSKKDEQRSKLESMSFLPGAIVGGIGLVFVIQYISKNSNYDDSNTIAIIIGGILAFFVMMFILPEQLVILYCKYKYKSFNFNERGYLYSSEDQKVKRKRGIEA